MSALSPDDIGQERNVMLTADTQVPIKGKTVFFSKASCERLCFDEEKKEHVFSDSHDGAEG